MPGEIPIVHSDRGGKLPIMALVGLWAIFYLICAEKKFRSRELVFKIEQSIICTLRELGIDGERE